ncbi:SDR family oxidoreductase [Nocardia sp. GAS34]|uniref:SDR family oxidoreductase n=1 Tax=Nocardia sp. GAS34 TaxID=3156305 RepID=UPI003D251475
MPNEEHGCGSGTHRHACGGDRREADTRHAGADLTVTISSVNAKLPDPTVMDYSAAKAALTNFSKALSKQVGAQGIRVNIISPGPVATDLWMGEQGVARAIAATAGGDPDDVARTVAEQTVTGRFTRPKDVAAVFLSSSRAENITGSDFIIDGGMITTL